METRDQEHHEKKKARETPIIDGDARPDINLNPENHSEEEKAAQKDRGKTTKNRVDTNSLEDFRDAKEG